LRKSGRGIAVRVEERVEDEAIIISCTLRKSERVVAEREEERVMKQFSLAAPLRKN
jgi:hypothetical protein